MEVLQFRLLSNCKLSAGKMDKALEVFSLQSHLKLFIVMEYDECMMFSAYSMQVSSLRIQQIFDCKCMCLTRCVCIQPPNPHLILKRALDTLINLLCPGHKVGAKMLSNCLRSSLTDIIQYLLLSHQMESLL